MEPACSHIPRKKDIEAGYSACMFCVETGECDGKKNYCRRHGVTWSVYDDGMADARNSAF